MSEHRDAGEMAALAMVPETDPERVALEAHVAGCGRCGAEWRRARRLASLVGTLAAPPPPSDAVLARARASVHAALASARGAAPRPSKVAGLAVAAAVLVSVALSFAFQGPPISVPRMLLALTTIGVAALLPSFAMRTARDAAIATVSALGLSTLLGLLDYQVLTMESAHALGCMRVELVAAALPVIAMLGVARSSDRRHGAAQVAAAGAAGALAGQGVLLTSCAADASALHVLAFHVAGVAIAALSGGALGALVPVTARR